MVEGRAALAAASRAGRLTDPGYEQALGGFGVLCDELYVVAVDSELTQRAAELSEEHSLRGYDAIHLASALVLGPETAMVTWDRELARAAGDAGLALAPKP